MTWSYCALALCLWAPLVGAGQDAGYIPGHPWTAIVPDPDSYDWSSTNRPGYRFRGVEPMHQRFYDYIQAKRAARKPLSTVDEMMIRKLIAVRRWPDGPRPNEFWAAYMRWLREQTTDQLNTAQHLLLTELMQRGFVVMDQAPSPETRRAMEYLQSKPFECRNWFERNILKVEPWMEYALASQGHNLAPPAVDGLTFPDSAELNGMQLTYDIAGSHPGRFTDRTAGDTYLRELQATFTPPCTITVAGGLTVSRFGQRSTLQASRQGATLMASIECGQERDFQREMITVPETGSAVTTFSIKLPIPTGAQRVTIDLALNGSYPMGSGVKVRNLRLRANLVAGPTPAEQAAQDQQAARQAADEAWRQEVERTLARLGYTNTAEGRELAAMRDALHGSDDDWRRYVDAQQRKLGYDTSPVANEMRAVEQAAETGGDAWAAYLRQQGVAPAGGGNQAIDLGDEPDAPAGGTLQFGTGLVDGRVTGVADSFVKPTRLTCKLDHQDLPPNSTLVAVWSRDGRELARSEQRAAGTGWVSFAIRAKNDAPLPPGRYRLSVICGARELGWGEFTVE